MNPAIFLGEPLHWGKIKIYPPKIKDVLANPMYGIYQSLLVLSQEDIWDSIAEKQGKALGSIPENGALTPFETLMLTCYEQPSVEELTKQAIDFFTHEQVRIIPETKTILFTRSLEEEEQPKDLWILNDENFFEFQNKIREVMGEKLLEPPNPNEHPKIAMMKAKARLRDRIKKRKGTKDSIDTVTMLGALCCMIPGLSPLNIGEMSYPAASFLFSMGQRKEKYETDLKVATAGFGNKKIKPKYWVTNEKD